MSFSSITFIWIFLPMVIVGYTIISVFLYKNQVLKDFFLLCMSLIFYLWGDIRALPLLVILIFICWSGGILLDKIENAKLKKVVLLLLVSSNLIALGYFKYLNFAIYNINTFFRCDIPQREAYFPLGISFIVFQAISYIVDVYRGSIKAERNLIKFSLYMAFFVQLISGPIIRFGEFQENLRERNITSDKVLRGIKRFIRGLAKKVIIADCLGNSVDTILALDQAQIGSALAWFVWVGYSLQIYYDFSGYTDMAIGLGQAFGFQIPENFDLPYLSQSVQEFWRRWHITLSSWFRDYLYIPLGGNRKGNIRTYVNLIIIFTATGLWHGSSWNFVFWGIWHGFFMLIERAFLGKWLKNNRLKFINVLYTVVVVFSGWMFFRISSIHSALYLFKLMLIPTAKAASLALYYFINPYVLFVLIIAILFCGPIQRLLNEMNIEWKQTKWRMASFIGYAVILCYSLTQVVSSTYSAFIYQQF